MPASLPPTTLPPTPGPTPSGPPGQQYHKTSGGLSLGFILVLIGAFLAMIVIPLVIANSIGNNADEDIAQDREDVEAQVFANDDGPLSPDEIERITVVKRCAALDGQPTAEVTLLNDSDGDRSYSITMEFEDDSGRLLDGFVDISLAQGEERDFTSRGPQLSADQGLQCKVGSVFRFVG